MGAKNEAFSMTCVNHVQRLFPYHCTLKIITKKHKLCTKNSYGIDCWFSLLIRVFMGASRSFCPILSLENETGAKNGAFSVPRVNPIKCFFLVSAHARFINKSINCTKDILWCKLFNCFNDWSFCCMF